MPALSSFSASSYIPSPKAYPLNFQQGSGYTVKTGPLGTPVMASPMSSTLKALPLNPSFPTSIGEMVQLAQMRAAPIISNVQAKANQLMESMMTSGQKLAVKTKPTKAVLGNPHKLNAGLVKGTFKDLLVNNMPFEGEAESKAVGSITTDVSIKTAMKLDPKAPTSPQSIRAGTQSGLSSLSSAAFNAGAIYFAPIVGQNMLPNHDELSQNVAGGTFTATVVTMLKPVLAETTTMLTTGSALNSPALKEGMMKAVTKVPAAVAMTVGVLSAAQLYKQNGDMLKNKFYDYKTEFTEKLNDQRKKNSSTEAAPTPPTFKR